MVVSWFFVFLCVAVAIGIALIIWRTSAAKGKGANANLPSCGGCGYAVRGVTTLKCPECGADLREVGIRRPGEGRSALAGCLPPLLSTIMLLLISVLGYNLLGLVIPTHRQQSTHFDLTPASGEYSDVLFETELTLVYPPGSDSYGSGLQMSTAYTSPPITMITFGDTGTEVVVERVAMEVMSAAYATSAGVMTYGPPFEVDPKSKLATWTDAQGTRRTSQGPVTDMDVLAFLGAAGANTSNSDVINEAQQLHAMIDGLLYGTNQFTMLGFESGGYGTGGSQQMGPTWFLPAYVFAWLVLWVVGLVFLVRRSRKQAKG